MTNYRKIPKNIDKLAELAAENYAHDIMGCIRTVKAVMTQWQRQDMFSCDVLGKRADGSLVALQVTASEFHQAVDSRKRKIEKEFWHISDTVQILQMVQAEKVWRFKVYEYCHKLQVKAWLTGNDFIPIPKHWFKKFKPKV